jgi:hypothetical protein
MKKMDAWKIYEQFSKDKTEVKGNSIRKVAEFIFDNNYNPNFDEAHKKIDISQSMNSINLNDFNGTASIYSNALGRSNERPSRIALKNMKKNMRDVNKEETFNPMNLKDECEKLENDYNNYLKELNEIKQKINDLNAKNKYRYIAPDINFSSINKKMFFILFGVSFLLGFFLTK